jgi:hypothetical protein
VRSNRATSSLYSILNSMPGQLCDRAYLPAADLAARLRERDQRPVRAWKAAARWPAFDILGFSLSYELGGTNILEMLDLAQACPAGGRSGRSAPEPSRGAAR